MHVKIEVGQGNQVLFAFPLEADRSLKIPVSQVINPIIEAAKKFLEGHIGWPIKSVQCFAVGEPRELILYKVTAFIMVKGALEGLFILSVEEQVLREMVRKFVLDKLTPEEETEYLEDVLTEVANTVLGNSLKSFPGQENNVVIDTPVSLISEKSLVRYQESQVSLCNLETEAGNLKLGLIIP